MVRGHVPWPEAFPHEGAGIEREARFAVREDAAAEPLLDFDEAVGDALLFQFPRRRNTRQPAADDDDFSHR